MSPFIIFTIVLTVLYVFYYTAILATDILVKPSASKATEEVIEIDEDDEVASVIVEEGSDGFGIEIGSYVEDGDESINEVERKEEKAPRFDIHIIDEKLQDIAKSYSVVVVSKDMKDNRLRALGVSFESEESEENEENEENEEEGERTLEENDWAEIMNAEANVVDHL